MITDRNTLFYRYWNALQESAEGDIKVAPGTIRLALRLAIDDAIALAAPAQTLDQRVNEHLGTQIARLNDWLQVHEPGLYISPGDTADATLAALGIRDRRIAELHADLEKLQTDVDAECADLQEELTSARNELALLIAARDSMRQQLAQMDADNADLTQRLSGATAEIDRLTRENAIAVDTFNSLATNGASAGSATGANPTPAAQLPDWGRNHPAWEALPKADLSVIDQLCTETTTFRRLDKSIRRNLVHRAIRHLASNGTLGGSAWDRLRPMWMPTQGAVVMLSSDGHWPTLVAEALNQATATA